MVVAYLPNLPAGVSLQSLSETFSPGMHSAEPRTGIRRAQTQRINQAVDAALQGADVEALLTLLALTADEATIPLSSLDAELAALLTTVKTAVARGACYLRVHTDCPALVHRWQDRRGDDAMRHRDTPSLPVGKLPPEMLARLLVAAPLDDPRVLVGPGVGLDCAVIDLDEQLLVCKSDPVTFATDQLGDYLVQVNANDLATTGATPSWLLVTLLLPENVADEAMAERLMGQIGKACRELDIALVGGHTEITYGLDRPVAVGALLGLVERGHLVTPRGARPGDRLLLTKSVPIETTAILARERSAQLRDVLTNADIAKARGT